MQNVHGWTPLSVAAAAGHTGLTNTLIELGAELGRVLVHEARVVLREARGRRRLHKIMAAGEKEAARPAGVNETQGCRRAEPVETHDLDQLPTRGAQAGAQSPWDWEEDIMRGLPRYLCVWGFA